MTIRVVHYLNQFFGGIGGEDRASVGVQVRDGAVGPGLALKQVLPDDFEIVATVICGDDYFAEHRDEALAQVLAQVKASGDALVAGPAFNAGRYGLACGEVCLAASRDLGMRAVTGMYPENPGAVLAQEGVYVIPTAASVVGMREATGRIARLLTKLARGEEVGPAMVDGYLPRGPRRNLFAEQTGAERAVEMLLRRLSGEQFTTEIPVPDASRVPPAAPVSDIRQATLALVTEGGIVPHGNPDRIEAVRATRWAKYPIAGLDALSGEHFRCIHGGFDNTNADADPNRIVPLDAARRLEREGAFGKLYDYFYTTVGNGTSKADAERFAREIGQELLDAGVQGVILVGT